MRLTILPSLPGGEFVTQKAVRRVDLQTNNVNDRINPAYMTTCNQGFSHEGPYWAICSIKFIG